MSIPGSAAKSSSATSGKNATALKSHKESTDLKGVQDAIERMQKHTPEKPYILTVPVNPSNEYHHYSRHEAESWRYHTPFERHEERLQYMTFVYRDHLDSCFVVRTEVDEERDRRARLGLSGISSGNSTPYNKASSAPKKKISLADWKNKKDGGKLPLGNDTQKTEETTTNGIRAEEVKPVSMTAAPQQGQKRSLDDHLDALEVKAAPKTAAGAPPPVKKSRTSPPPSNKALHPITPSKNPHGLPPLQSPIKVTSAPHGLPAILSPTLPLAIEEELSRLSSDRTISSNPSSAEKPSKKQPPNGERLATTISAKSDTTLPKRLSDTEEHRSKVISSVDSEIAHAKQRPSPATAAKLVDGGRPVKKERLMVTLKYGKKRRKLVQDILKLPSRGSRAPTAKPPANGRDQSVGGTRTDSVHEKDHKVASHKTPTASKAEKLDSTSAPEKRKAPDDDKRDVQPAAKRQKGLSTLDLNKQPSTPQQHLVPSPSLATFSGKSNTQKSHINDTPRKDLRTVQMGRSLSSDSNTKTPQATGGTPLGPRPTSAPGGRAAEAERWTSLSTKYSQLGRRLKHEYQALASNKSATEKERKRAAVLALESLLSYILTFHCENTAARLEHRPVGLTQSWLTLLPLWSMYLRSLAPYPHLEGLCYHLGVVIRSTISQIIGERMTNAAKKESSAADKDKDSRHGSADAPTPTPSASGNGSVWTGLPKMDVMGQNLTELHRCAVQGSIKLSVQELMVSFPKSWAAQSGQKQRPSGTLPERDPYALLSGKWWLPIGMETTPVQGVRAGLKLLEEWLEKEGGVGGLELVILTA